MRGVAGGAGVRGVGDNNELRGKALKTQMDRYSVLKMPEIVSS